MTIRLDMRRRVSRADETLGDSSDMVRRFLHGQLAPDGGFQGRDGRSDLYYSVFGLEASLALGVDLPHERINAYLDSFGMGDSLDLVHLTSLIRCRANMGGSDAVARASRPYLAGPDTAIGWRKQDDPNRDDPCSGTREAPARRLLEYRSKDGGFNTTAAASTGSVYGSFLALGAWQDLGLDVPDPEVVAESVRSLHKPDGGFSNDLAMTVSATPATAAAVCILHYLRQPVPESAARWLLDRAGPHGGFMAFPSAGDLAAPDLLSTATALYALSLVGALAPDDREKHLDYLDSLWSTQGGFHGCWGDETVDCEYTYYGLLSLGCLAG